MAIVTCDLETFYARDYTLTRMTTAEYNLDPRFQPLMLSLKVDDGPTEVLVGDAAIRSRLVQIDPDKTALLSHYINFDGSILFWHFGFAPKLYLCTLSMARAITHWIIGKSSLAALSTHLGLPPKGDEVVRALGKRLENFTEAELAAYADYCIRDNENCRAAFDQLRPYFTNTELQLIDLIARMFIMPQVKLNAGALAMHLAEVQTRKAEAFDRLGYVDREIFSSQPRFAAYLQSLGVEVPLKPSPTGEGMIPALAKGDRAFREMCEDPSLPMDVQVALAVRLEAKSTIEETRTQRMLTQARLRWPDGSHGHLPVPLRYYAARTGRLGGDDKLNLQNLPRGSAIRAAIEAPSDRYRLVHRDASQIEARMVAWLAQEPALLAAFAAGADVYSAYASDLYRQPVTRSDTLRRFVGKTAILGLGYGCGADKFRHMLFIGQGGVSMKVETVEAQTIVDHYRGLYPAIPRLWRFGNKVIDKILEPDDKHAPEKSHIPISYGAEKVFLPNEMYLFYPGLKRETNDEGYDEVLYKGAHQNWVKLYGAKFIENLSQALSRIIITDIAVRVYVETGYHPYLSTHDSLDYCVPVDEVEAWDELLAAEFAVVPTWAQAREGEAKKVMGQIVVEQILPLPLASEGGWGRNLLEAERGTNQ